jgi:MazG family protein
VSSTGGDEREATAAAAAALTELDQITHRLRQECPWDREQDAASIVPHTVEEAYEVAEAVQQEDDAKLLDELGDVLFQVHFLALLLEERGVGDLAAVARHVSQKLIRRHPHVYGDAEAETAAAVLRNWDAIKRTEEGRRPGVFGEVPENLPGLLYTRKVQQRAAASGFDPQDAAASLDTAHDQLQALDAISGAATGAPAGAPAGEAGDAADGEANDAVADVERFRALGDVLFAVVSSARKLDVDPELAVRAAAGRFRDRVQAGVDLAAGEGREWSQLDAGSQLSYYARARLGAEPDDGGAA